MAVGFFLYSTMGKKVINIFMRPAEVLLLSIVVSFHSLVPHTIGELSLPMHRDI